MLALSLSAVSTSVTQYNSVRFAFTVIIALVFGSTFWKIGQNRSACSPASSSLNSETAFPHTEPTALHRIHV